jgi:hypothetical protein
MARARKIKDQKMPKCDDVPCARFFVAPLREGAINSEWFRRFYVVYDDEDLPPDIRPSGEPQTRLYYVARVDWGDVPTICLRETTEVFPSEYVVEVNMALLYPTGARICVLTGNHHQQSVSQPLWKLEARSERRSRNKHIASESERLSTSS